MEKERKAASKQEEESRSALGAAAVDVQNEMPHLDFITACVLMVISVAVIITSIGYWKNQGLIFYESAGFMPTIIASVLFLISSRLLIESLKTGNAKARLAALRVSAGKTLRSKRVRTAAVGLGLFAIYIYGLLGKMPFWLASFLALTVILNFSHFDRTWKTAFKMVLIAAVAVAVIVGLFQYTFSVPMP